MAYCTDHELRALTGSEMSTTSVLTPIIASSDREIDLYLSSRGITGSACDALKEASLKLSHARVYQMGGNYSTSPSVYTAVQELRVQAFAILDQYVKTRAGIASNVYVRKVN